MSRVGQLELRSSASQSLAQGDPPFSEPRRSKHHRPARKKQPDAVAKGEVGSSSRSSYMHVSSCSTRSDHRCGVRMSWYSLETNCSSTCLRFGLHACIGTIAAPWTGLNQIPSGFAGYAMDISWHMLGNQWFNHTHHNRS